MNGDHSRKVPASTKNKRQYAQRAIAEALEPRCLLSAGFIGLSQGIVTVQGTPSSDTIAGGTTAGAPGDYYFLIQTAGQPEQLAYIPIAQVTSVQVFASPLGTAAVGPDANLVNMAGTNFEVPVSIYGGNGSDTLYGSQGSNTIITGTGSGSLVVGGPSPDVIAGEGSNETLKSGGGTDTIRASSGNNVLTGGRHGSKMHGGSGYDTLKGQAGNSTMYGSTLGSLMIGGFGNDYIVGGAGHDTTIGGSGHDTLISGTGGDYLDAGWDAWLNGPGAAANPVAADNDSINGSAAVSDTMMASSGSPTIVGGSGVNDYDVEDLNADLANVTGSDFVAENDTVTSSSQIIHINLTIQIDQQGVITDIPIPLGTGGSVAGNSSVIAVGSGSIDFVGPTSRVFTLADFFNHWGVDFSSLGVGEYVAAPGSGHTFSMTVNGVSHGQFGNYLVKNGDDIVLTYTT